MRIALVTHNVVRGDGQGRVNFEIAREALASGIQVEVFADRVDEQVLAEGAIWIRVCPTLSRPNLTKVREFALLADRALKAHSHANLVHAHGFTLSNAHHVNTCHMVHASWQSVSIASRPVESWPRRMYHRLYTSLNAKWERVAYSNAEIVVAPSYRVSAELSKVGVPKSKIRVIPNGVNSSEFYPGFVERRSLGLPEGVPMCLFAGGVKSPIKNLETVLLALSTVPDLHLAVAGEYRGSPHPDLVTTLKIGNRVHFLGFRNDLPDLMRAVDFFVFPSRYESFSLAILEALASGLPVVTSEVVGVAELLDETCSFVVRDPNDHVSIATAMSAIASDRELRAKMGQSARNVAARYSWRVMARKYIALYDEFL